MRKTILITSESASEKNSGKTSRQKHVEHCHFNDPFLILKSSDTHFSSLSKSECHGFGAN